MTDLALNFTSLFSNKFRTPKWLEGVDLPVFFISGGALLLFAAFALYDLPAVTVWVNDAFSVATHYFGAYWQALLLLTFIVALALAVGRTGSVVLGGLKAPEIPTFKWLSILMCTLLAGGGVFWAAAEPMAHFATPPPIYSAEAGSTEAAYNALAQSFMHWGFLAWAILGSLTGIVYMYLHYEKGLPLKPRTLLYPVFGEKIMTSWMGAAVDAMCVIAVVAGTVGPIGFLGLQVSFGLDALFGIPDTFMTQLVILAALIAIYTLSAISGVNKGIQLLSRTNIILSALLITYILVFGPTAFIFKGFFNGFIIYVENFAQMATFREDPQWLSWWTVFFWGWFLGYGPLMAMFVARISRGRTIRQMVLMISIVAPIITCFWFTIIGGSGLGFEMANPGVISEPFAGMNMPAALIAITQQLPMGTVISVLFLLLTTLFVATTGDSMTYSVSMVMTGTDSPQSSIRVFWGIIMGVVAALLISVGDGGVSALQSFIVVTAVPVSFVLLPSLWTAPMIARKMAKEQGCYSRKAVAVS